MQGRAGHRQSPPWAGGGRSHRRRGQGHERTPACRRPDRVGAAFVVPEQSGRLDFVVDLHHASCLSDEALAGCGRVGLFQSLPSPERRLSSPYKEPLGGTGGLRSSPLTERQQFPAQTSACYTSCTWIDILTNLFACHFCVLQALLQILQHECRIRPMPKRQPMGKSRGEELIL